MRHKKKKANINIRAKPGTDHPQSAGWRTLFYPISIMLQVFTEDSLIL